MGAVNHELLALYYGIGRYVPTNIQTKNCGTGAIERISEQLQQELSGLRGYSAHNLKNMRTFFEEWQVFFKSAAVAADLAPSDKD